MTTIRIRPTSLLVLLVGSPSTNRMFDSALGAKGPSTFLKELGLSLVLSGTAEVILTDASRLWLGKFGSSRGDG